MTYALSSAAPLNIAPPIGIVSDRLLRLSQVMEIVGLRRTRIYEMIKLGMFPAPCKPGGSASRWSENAVLAWVAECVAPTIH